MKTQIYATPAVKGLSRNETFALFSNTPFILTDSDSIV